MVTEHQLLPLRDEEANGFVPPVVVGQRPHIFRTEPACGHGVETKPTIERKPIRAFVAVEVEARPQRGNVAPVVPLDHDNVAGNLFDRIAVEAEEVVPHHHPLAVPAADGIGPSDKRGEKRIATVRGGKRGAARAATHVPCLVKTDVEIRPGEDFAEFGDMALEEVARRGI